MSPATSSIDGKKPRLSNGSNRSLEVELGWVRNTVLHPDICTTDTLAFSDSLQNKVGQAYVSGGIYSVIVPGYSRHAQGL